MYKDKGTIEEEIRDIYENTLNINYKETILTENNLNILNAVIHQIRQDDLNAIKDMIFCNQPIYEKLKPNQILNEIIKYLDNLNK